MITIPEPPAKGAVFMVAALEPPFPLFAVAAVLPGAYAPIPPVE